MTAKIDQHLTFDEVIEKLRTEMACGSWWAAFEIESWRRTHRSTAVCTVEVLVYRDSDECSLDHTYIATLEVPDHGGSTALQDVKEWGIEMLHDLQDAIVKAAVSNLSPWIHVGGDILLVPLHKMPSP
jgi:hypothetical protein